MKKQRLPIALILVAVWVFGCKEDNNAEEISPPLTPSRELLEAGPESGKQFLKWNSNGLAIVGQYGASIDGWCTPQTEARIDIPEMVGMTVPVGATPVDSLHCTMTVADTNYAQIDYFPEGTNWLDSVSYWVDTNTVQIPAGTTASGQQFYWYNPATGQMVAVNTRISNSGHWVAKTMHFSRYILGQKRTIL